MYGKVIFSALLSLGLLACNNSTTEAKPAATALQLKSQQDRVSYSIGHNIGNNLKQQKIDVTANALIQGLRDGISGGKLLMTEDEMKATMQKFQTDQMAKMKKKQQETANKNNQEGEKFLAENGKKAGVVSLESGLQYKITEAGTGKKPSATDTVVVNYRGSLIDGSEFDSSYKRGQPATFPVNGVIPGWTEALQLMKAGAKWQLFIPAKLAYGERGAGGMIGPNSTLIFDVELIEIKTAEKKG